MRTWADLVPTAAAETPLPTFAGGHNTASRYGSGPHPQPDNQRSGRPAVGVSSRWNSPRSYGEAWGTSRGTRHPAPGTEPGTWSGPGQGERPLNSVPPTGPRYSHSRPPWNRPPFMEDSRPPWKKPPSGSMETSTGTNSGRDSAYLSDWASRMGQARSQPRVGDDHVQTPEPVPEIQHNSSRYVPPHARPTENQNSGWRGRRGESSSENVGQHRGEWPPVPQHPPWRRSSATGILPTSISEPDQSASRPSNIIQNSPRVEDRNIESGYWRDPRSAHSRSLNSNQSPGIQSSLSGTTPATDTPPDADPQPRPQSSIINQSSNPTIERAPPVTSDPTIPVTTSSPSPGHRQHSLSQPGEGRDIQVYLDVLRAVLSPASNQNPQEEPVAIDSRILELLRRLSPPLGPVPLQQSSPRGDISEESSPGPPSLTEGTRIGNGEGRAPLESVGDDRIPVAALINQGAPTPSSVPHHGDSPESPRRGLPPTAVSATASPVANSTLRRSISAFTRSMADAWSRTRRPREQAYVTPSHVAALETDALPQGAEVRRLAGEATPGQVVASHQDALSQGSELRRLAEEATSLLELCTRTDIDQNDDERQQLIGLAIDSVLKMRGQQENSLNIQGGQGDIGHQEPEVNVAGDSTKVDPSCIVCCEQVADTVLLPCNHLVLCVTCCDTMRIMKRGARGRQSVPCPMCRRVVEDTIKVFRG